MPSLFETAPGASAVPITFATKSTWDAICEGLSAAGEAIRARQRLCRQAGGVPDLAHRRRKNRAGAVRPGRGGQQVPRSVSARAHCPACCRPASIASPTRRMMRGLPTLAFALGSYRFNRYRKADALDVRLVPPDGIDAADIARIAEAAGLARDLINTPSNDMGPAELARAAERRRDALWRQLQLHRRRGAGAAEFSADSCGRHGVDARAAADRFCLGRSRPPQGDAGRQGRLLRYRRARLQTFRPAC